MKKVIVTFLVALTVWMGGLALTPTPVAAAPRECEDYFLTFRPWYYGLVKEGSATCELKDINVEGGTTGEEIELTAFIWTIILNILSILFNLVGYLALGFIIYGGYLYLLAKGDPAKIAKGKNTVIRALIGLVVCILATLITNTIVKILTEAVGA